MEIDFMEMGGNENVKIHSRSSPPDTATYLLRIAN